jgi:ribosomal protein S18 acetylase RimI-like enzyme
VLLTNNEANLPFYERHGFEVVRRDQTPKDGPQAWAMVKAP